MLQVLSGQTPETVAHATAVCPRTMRKWSGATSLRPPPAYDRSSRPHRLNRPTPEPVVERICALRRQRWTGKQIAAEVGVSPATVSGS